MRAIKFLVIISFVIILAACSSEESTVNNKVAQASQINVRLGLGYLQRGDTVRAKQKLLLALKQDPDSTSANSAMAYYLERTGDLQDAENYYQKAISVADVKGGPENNYGTFLCRQGRYQEAQEYFDKAASDDDYSNTGKVYENAGLCAMLNSNTQQAQQDFEKALKANPRLTTSILQLANIQYDLANYKKANTYIAEYNAAGGKQTAEALWLQIRLAQRSGNTQEIYALGTKLRNNYPDSTQYRNYQQLRASLQ